MYKRTSSLVAVAGLAGLGLMMMAPAAQADERVCRGFIG